ncbi:unnamed protein product [Adineta ricciae]|uniref:Uncharacterized protein n=1 Tax=Adineta ricciae TaxID=249248 RepID=A0A814S187_ADIRI|nr:unnamed protein product [Adineta ricciae]
MNCDSTLYGKVKREPDHGNIDRLKHDLVQQKEEYERQINQLKKAHDEQICKFCTELEKSSTLLHEYKLELDAMRSELNSKEKQLKLQTNSVSSNDHSQAKPVELVTENIKLKKDLAALTSKYQTLNNEIQDARQYILKMIEDLE